VSTHEHCYREYRAAKGHTECIICHNRDYVRAGRQASSSEDAVPPSAAPRVRRRRSWSPDFVAVYPIQPNYLAKLESYSRIIFISSIVFFVGAKVTELFCR
jgi:hypothetical protein